MLTTHRGTMSETTSPDSQTGLRTVKRRDAEDRLVEEQEFNDGELVGRKTWTYDDAGNLVHEAVDEDGKGLKYYDRYEYDQQGRQVRRDYGFYAEPGPFRRWATTYADDGRSAVRIRTRIADGREHSRQQLEYDAKGRLIGRVALTSEGVVDSTAEWTYDDLGRLLTERTRVQTNPPTLRQWRYSHEGDLLERTEDWGADGTTDKRMVFTYECW